jgi:hypothetical protein
MTTYLNLCKRLRAECGMTGTGPTTVVAQTGEYERAVNWIADADQDIQNKYSDWRFRWASFSFNTVASQGSYTETEMLGAGVRASRWEHDTIRFYLTSAGQITENWMLNDEWESFYAFWRYGNMRTAEGVPNHYAFAPDRTMHLGYIPNDIYTITGQYYRMPVRLEADADEPLYPEEFHMLPVWWAMVNYAGFEETSFQYTHAQNMLNRLWGNFENQERKQAFFGASLA